MDEQAKALEKMIAGGEVQKKLWYGVLIGPLAWKLQLVTNYALVSYTCWHRLEILNHATSLVFFLLAVSGAFVGWKVWHRVGFNADMGLGGVIGRTRFLAAVGVVLSSYLALLIFGQWLPHIFLSPCDGIS